MTQNPPISSHVARALSDDPRVLAKHAIRLLEQSIYADFGLKLRMGAELEFSLVPREGNISPDSIVINDAKYPKTLGHVPARERPSDNTIWFDRTNADGKVEHVKVDDVRDALFPDSPIVSFTYNESAKSQLEAVISHQARHDRLEPDGSRALGLARSIEALRSTLATADTPGRRYSRRRKLNDVLKSMSAQWQPNFDGMLELEGTDARTHGLHLNISFVDAHNQPLPEAFYRNDERLLYGVCPIMNEGAHLLTPDQSSIDRLWQRHSVGKNNGFKADKPHQKRQYFELSAPSANSDSYYAVMLALASVYDCLDRGKFDLSSGDFTTPEKLVDRSAKLAPPQSHTQPRARYEERFFDGKRRLIGLLDRLEPGLGSRFETAVRHHPPQDKRGETLGL